MGKNVSWAPSVGIFLNTLNGIAGDYYSGTENPRRLMMAYRP